jgi:hypothetical protein
MLRTFFSLLLGAVIFGLNAYVTVHHFVAHHHDHDHHHVHEHDAAEGHDEDCPVCEYDFAAFLGTAEVELPGVFVTWVPRPTVDAPVHIPRFRADLPDLRGPPMA